MELSDGRDVYSGLVLAAFCNTIYHVFFGDVMFNSIDPAVTFRSWSEVVLVLEIADARVTELENVCKKLACCFAFSLSYSIDILMRTDKIVCGIKIGVVEGWCSEIIFILVVVLDDMVLDEKCETSSDMVGVSVSELGE
jgi:hypothetical protein